MEITLTTLQQDASPDVEAESVACTAETAECTCPDFCERDHEND